MNFIKKVFGLYAKKGKIKERSEEEKLADKLKPFQWYLYKSQEIVTWEDPNQSFLALFLVNILFWFLSYMHLRLYGVIFSIICMMIAHEAWVDHIWPEISVKTSETHEDSSEPPREGVLTVPEISHYATGIRAAVSIQYAKLRYLRNTQPPLYCAIVSAGCLFMAGIGSLFSGMALLYLTTMAIMVMPGVVKHVLPLEWKSYVMSILTSLSSLLIPPDGSMEDYIPESNKENLLLLNQAGDNFDLSTPSSDSSLGDLMIPGHDESSVDSFMLPSTPARISDDSDSDAGSLKFKPEHFDQAEKLSSDEDSSLVKDLSFPDVPPSSGLKDAVAGVFYKTFPKAFSSSRYPSSPPQLEDSDSDFEIIDNDETS